MFFCGGFLSYSLLLLFFSSYTDVEIRELLTSMPQLLGLSLSSNIIPTIDYYLSVGVTREYLGQALLSMPALLAYSLENRIKPRAREMKSRGILISLVSLGCVTMPEVKYRAWLDKQLGTWSLRDGPDLRDLRDGQEEGGEGGGEGEGGGSGSGRERERKRKPQNSSVT